jgi:hypothetical protein
MTPLETFKRQFIAYMSYYDLGDVSTLWRDRPARTSLPDWVGATLCIQGPLDGIFECLCDDWAEDQNDIESLMQKCGVWYELDGDHLWLYDVNTVDW